MTKPNPFLRIHRESVPEDAAPAEIAISLAALCRDFEKVTGWPLRFVPQGESKTQPDPMWSAPVNPGVGISPGTLIIDRVDTRRGRRTQLAEAIELATTLAQTLGELSQARDALRKREAELAAGVPVVSSPTEEAHLAARLEAVLKAGAEALGCERAALYLLDAATTELKLRSCWGLPPSKLAEPARPLPGAIADLEALAGSAVALEDDALNVYWNVPEVCGAALCVPVSSPTTLLGTLWFYSRQPRPFSDAQTNQAEIIAGRIAADLEREMLLSAGLDAQRMQRQLHEAERLQENQLPRVAPLLDGWEVAGWNEQTCAVGGDFFDWSVLSDGRLAMMLGDALERGVSAALAAASLRTALRTHAEYGGPAGQVLTRVGRTLWTGSAGDLFASALFGQLDPETGELEYATGGRVGMLLLHGGEWRPLTHDELPLATQPDHVYATRKATLAPGAVLIAYSDGVRDAIDHTGRSLGDALLAEALLPHLAAPARELVDRVRDALESHAVNPELDDRTVLVIRRVR